MKLQLKDDVCDPVQTPETPRNYAVQQTHIQSVPNGVAHPAKRVPPPRFSFRARVSYVLCLAGQVAYRLRIGPVAKLCWRAALRLTPFAPALHYALAVLQY